MDLSVLLITLGILCFAGLAADEIGRRTALPRVTILMLCGLVAGRSGLGLVPEGLETLFEFLSVSALTMVALLLGGSLSSDNLKSHGRQILWISVTIVGVTTVGVSTVLVLAGAPLAMALVLGAIASATAPAATIDAIRHAGASGPFAETLRGIVAIDDAWGLLVFSFVLAFAHSLGGPLQLDALSTAGWEIFGALILALVIGIPAAALTGRITHGEPLMAEALGLTFLTAGLAIWLEVSFLIAGMGVGALIVNRAKHHTRAFHEIEHAQWPFMILFFFLAGASLEIDRIGEVGLIGALYVLVRIATRVSGGWIGAKLGRAPRHEWPWYGVALLPQAGVAIGMALVAAEALPEYAPQILSLAIGATVIFELIGPAATVFAVRRVAARESTG